MNCYECKHRSSIPGDAHSCCLHPETGLTSGGDLFSNLVSIFDGSALDGGVKMGIQLNPHGVRNGWAMWPANFDPIWVTNCNCFEKKELKDGAST